MLFSVEHFFLHISLIIDQIRHDGTLQVIATIDCILMELSCLSTELSTVFVGKCLLSRNDLIVKYPCYMATSSTIW